jgi:RNA-directed DNA polymerase
MGKTVERNSGQARARVPDRWKDINWARAEGYVSRVQGRIFRATREEDFRKVKNLQKLLSRSRNATLVAIRRVTQINSGKRTAGIDGKLYASTKEKEQLAIELQGMDWSKYRCSPVRRVRIPKPGRQETRPLGIPTIKDRVIQMLVKMALEPEWEAKFERNSYGFRPGRRCMDAITQIHRVVAMRKTSSKDVWILDADISKCFDMIDHEALLKKIPVFTNVTRHWLKAGAIEFGKFFKTRRGTPQGGIISPLLANIALDGMDRLFGAIDLKGVYLRPSVRKGKDKGICVVRYADDFVVTAPSREAITNHVLPRLREFLEERGLQLSGAKTRIVRREEGFDFLGFHVRQFISKYGRICRVKPSKKNIMRLLRSVKDVVNKFKQVAQSDIIDMLNPKLRGWAYYFRYCNAKRIFSYVDYRVYKMLWHWSFRRHRKENKGKVWVKRKYFPRLRNREWTFADKPGHVLFYTSTMKCGMRGYIKVKGDASPFDPSLRKYWLKRHGKIPQVT